MRVVIIEDEKLLRETNRKMLQSNFPNMEVVGEAASIDDSIKLLKETKPDLVLLDIELEDGNCFQVLQACKPYTFKIVFITAYSEFAIKAIKFCALDYILKPLNEYEFCSAINKAIELDKPDELLEQSSYLEQQYAQKKCPEKILLRTVEALHIVNVCDILYCKSDNSYTTFYLTNNKEVLVSKSIKEYDELLSSQGFIRPHQSYLVNINAIEKMDKTDGGFIILHNQKEIPVSKRRKQWVFDTLEKMAD